MYILHRLSSFIKEIQNKICKSCTMVKCSHLNAQDAERLFTVVWVFKFVILKHHTSKWHERSQKITLPPDQVYSKHQKSQTSSLCIFFFSMRHNKMSRKSIEWHQSQILSGVLVNLDDRWTSNISRKTVHKAST